MRTWSKKIWRCPYFRGEEGLCLRCEGGALTFPDELAREAHVGRFCCQVEGWRWCAIARFLGEYYARREE